MGGVDVENSVTPDCSVGEVEQLENLEIGSPRVERCVPYRLVGSALLVEPPLVGR